MAITRLGLSKAGNDSGKASDDDEMKPIVREYGKENPSIYQESHQVISGNVSKSGLWCVIHTANYVVLLRTSSSAVKELFEVILPALNGKKANWVVVEPVKKNKNGGCIGVDDEVQGWYSFDESNLSFEVGDVQVPIEKKQGKLELSMFLDARDASSSMEAETDTEKTSSGTSRKRKAVVV